MKPANLVLPPFPVLAAIAVLAMLGLQGLIEYRLLAPLAQDAVKLSEDIQHQQAQAAPTLAPRSKTNAQLEEILSRLPTQDATSTRIERLHQIASEHGVVLRKASYRSQAMPGNISRHEIQADLAGAYPAIRQFLRALLAQDQAAAVDSLEFSRPPGSGGVRAQVRMTLYLRAIAS